MFLTKCSQHKINTEKNSKFANIDVHQGHDLRRTAGGRRGAALSTTVKLDRDSEVPLNEQLRLHLTRHQVRVIDLFRDWDEDGNGFVDKDEFFRALCALGVPLSKKEADEFFATFDPDGSGSIDSFCETVGLKRYGWRLGLARKATQKKTEPKKS